MNFINYHSKPPPNPKVGDAYFNTNVKKLYVNNGFLWLESGGELIVTMDMLWDAVLQVENEALDSQNKKP